jgi:hypothetical protein
MNKNSLNIIEKKNHAQCQCFEGKPCDKVMKNRENFNGKKKQFNNCFGVCFSFIFLYYPCFPIFIKFNLFLCDISETNLFMSAEEYLECGLMVDIFR